MTHALPLFLGNSHALPLNGFVLVPLVLWSVFWKGVALWHAARREEKWWFIGLLVIDTVGIAELIYLFFVVHIFSSTPSVSKTTRHSRRK